MQSVNYATSFLLKIFNLSLIHSIIFLQDNNLNDVRQLKINWKVILLKGIFGYVFSGLFVLEKPHIFHFRYKMSYSHLFSLDTAKQPSRTCFETDNFLPYMGNILIFPRPYLKSCYKMCRNQNPSFWAKTLKGKCFKT